MSYQYNIQTSKKDLRSSICLFIDHKLATIVKLFLSTFLVAYIYSFSENIFNYILNVGLYEIASYTTMLISYFVVAYFVDKTNRVWIYRIGVILRAVFVVFAIFYGKDLSKLILLAGFLNGFSQGVYYSAFNTIQQEMVSRKSVKSFMLLSNITAKVVDVVFPLILGALIEISTFAQVAIYVFILCIIQIGISFGIRAKKPDNSFFSIKQYLKDLKENENTYAKMKVIYLTCFVYGFTTIITTIVNICIMIEFNSNLSLGVFTSIFAFIAIVTIMIVNKFAHIGKRTNLFLFIAVFQLAFTALFSIIPNIYTLILFNLANAVGYIIYRTILDIHRNANLKESGLYGGITEHQVIMEIMFDISRVISYGALILLGNFHSLIAFKIFLVLMSISASMVLVLLAIYERKFYSNISNDEKAYKIIKKCLLNK